MKLNSPEIAEKSILVISFGYPHPRRGASTVIFYLYLQALRKSNFRVEHLLLVSSDEVSDHAHRDYLAAISPGPMFGVKVFTLPNARDARREGLNLHACVLPVEVIEYVALIRPDATVCFDLVAADLAQQMGLDRLLIWLGDLSFQTILYHAYYDFKTAPHKPWGLIRAYLGSFLWKRYYRRVLFGQRHIIVSSSSSVRQLTKLGVSSDYWPYPWPQENTGILNSVTKNSKPTFIMFGTLSALGSRSGFDFLLKSIYPILLRMWGSRAFSIIIGGISELPDWVRADISSFPEIVFKGFIEDLSAEVAHCHAVLAPISAPVGNRTRIITAMSMGALVIAHANTALANPELVSGKNCLLATSAMEFAEHMRLSFVDLDCGIKMGAAGRQVYLKSFGTEAVSQRLVRELDLMFDSKNQKLA